jgi:phosphate/sulfate permease
LETYYLILVGILFLFAISDLIVGVSNDAVNFLNSAIGAKAAPFWVIMLIASLGIVVGATFSSGMMEVARKGIFNPASFEFADIMIIFIAVMITDLILLDTYNTFGLPTSTTVSIVFELLGGAVVLSIIKLNVNGEALSQIGNYINTDKAFLIKFGILLSIVVDFSVGAIIQYITRLIFSFNYEKSFKYGGAIFGGVAITSITYFLLIKGAKGSSFISAETLAWIKENTMMIIAVCFVGWAVLLQLLRMLFKFDILKFSVLAGTFALAMAFAGNDLVNFIGVPLAGLEAFNSFIASGSSEHLLMESLSGKVATPTLYLLIAGLIMVITLVVSKKAKSVTATSLNLSNQNQEAEQFGSSSFARGLVRSTITISDSIGSIIPKRLSGKIKSRFEIVNEHKAGGKDAPSFDMIRATVNLLVAGILISIATSFKLPLSTTYVTFMVLMGTSLADGVWGRETAVYRITGVITVIGGWFLTAITAFTVCGLFAYLIYIGGGFSIGILIMLAVLILLKLRKLHKKRAADKKKSVAHLSEIQELDVTKRCSSVITKTFKSFSVLYVDTINGLIVEDRKKLKATMQQITDINNQIKSLKDNVNITVKEMKESSVESSHHFVQVLDYIREAAHCLTYFTSPVLEHVANNHTGITDEQKQELIGLSGDIKGLFILMIGVIEQNEFDDIQKLVDAEKALIEKLNELRMKQIRRIKYEKAKTRNSMLYLGILHET